MMRRVLVTAVLAACGAGGDGADLVDAPAGSDAPANPDGDVGCVVAISFTPTQPIAAQDQLVRLKAEIANAPGVQSYDWHVFRGAAPITVTPAQLDSSEVTFSAATPGTYDAFLDVDVPGIFCMQGQAQVEVKTPGAGQAEFRVHVVAPLPAVPTDPYYPPADERVIVEGGATDTLPDIVLAQGTPHDGLVRGNGAPIAAYLRFMPITNREAVVESFSDGTGAYNAVVRGEAHDVLVIPASTAFAPRILPWMPGQTTLDVDGGSTITGVVRDNTNTLLAGATVQLAIAGVPTTYATTNASGAFTVRGVVIPGAVVSVDVSAPASRGLPRLVASSTNFDLSQPVTIRYTAMTVRDLAGTVVRRGTPLPNAEVNVVGTIASAGTVTAGAAATASGELRATATTNGSGVLPTLRAPAKSLDFVVVPAPGDFARGVLDLMTTVPATIDAPAMAAVTTRARSPVTPNPGIAGATLDAVPQGELALASAPTVRAVADASGNFDLLLAAGGTYKLVYADPANNFAQTVEGPVATGAIPASKNLLAATRVTALVKGVANVRRASIQMLCSTGAACTGLARSVPIAEGVTGIDGTFTLAVPKP